MLKMVLELTGIAKQKQDYGLVFVMEGYCYEWSPDDSKMVSVYTHNFGSMSRADLKAVITFSDKPVEHGINGGKVTNLLICSIDRHSSAPKSLTASGLIRKHYIYNSGRVLEDHLENNESAKELYDAVLRVMN
ncbi:hypothetical protein J4216_03010 [Candidatus Woesearchaeota archaeon]|nr:hypothetical protein [Candidatus Woesearchaeota archaeon]